MIYYHSSVDAGTSKNFVLGGGVVGGLSARADLVGPTYTFEMPGRPAASISATLTGPHGQTLSGSRSDDRAAFGDLIPQAALKWNFGVNNAMAYVTGDITGGRL